MVLLLVVGWARSYWYFDNFRITRSGTELAVFTDPGELVISYQTDAVDPDGIAFESVSKSERLLEAKMLLGIYGMSGVAYRERQLPAAPFNQHRVWRVAMAPFWLVITCTILVGVFAAP
jgi:hypothetical protein